tara:strand:- start:350 stop:643 length:294 start_codon:yes stop_codon:yes gene_type:complete
LEFFLYQLELFLLIPDQCQVSDEHNGGSEIQEFHLSRKMPVLITNTLCRIKNDYGGYMRWRRKWSAKPLVRVECLSVCETHLCCRAGNLLRITSFAT